MTATVAEVMASSGVAFGTSGARGLADAMTDRVCHVYTRGFLSYLRHIGELPASGSDVIVGGDLRPSTDRIMAAVFRAIVDAGHTPLNAGKVPSPAVAAYGFERGIPGIMVTGSHIPDDRNGIKFNKVSGEVLKEDEAGIKAQVVAWDERAFDDSGASRIPATRPPTVDEVRGAYVRRYRQAFPGRPLEGMRLGVYQHSAVGRDVVVEILSGLGAEVTAMGRSDRFVPVDTEAIRPEDVAWARGWAARQPFDALVSTDGDSDRPLIADAHGEWLRGDVAGPLCARYLGADTVVTPVSSNSVVERCGWFQEVRRTRIGSPYVVAAMAAAAREGRGKVVGYEANGGFLVQSDFEFPAGTLPALPTRDAMVPILGVLLLARRERCSVARLVATLPARFTASDRIEAFPTERGRAVVERYSGSDDAAVFSALDRDLGPSVAGRVAGIDRTDGLRVSFDTGDVVHLRPSGNAPEFRCYVESGSPERAASLCRDVLRRIRGWKDV